MILFNSDDKRIGTHEAPIFKKAEGLGVAIE